MDTLNYKLSKKGYILNGWNKIEKISYSDYLREYGGDETTTPLGIAPRLFQDGRTIYTWGCTGNKRATYKNLDSKKEAKMFLYSCFESYIQEKNWDAPRFFLTKKELYQDFSEIHNKSKKVIKRYFKIQEAEEKRIKDLKIKYDNRPFFTVEMMKNFISKNKDMIEYSLQELNELKISENKDLWQVKANALIQKVSNNDFRILKWKEIYNLIKSEVEPIIKKV